MNAHEINVIDGHSVGIITASVSYIQQFIKVYCPLLLVLVTIIKLIFDYRLTPDEKKALEYQQHVDIIKTSKQYTHFTDDRRSRKGDENDIYMLKSHGYDKFRFVSKSFLKRNGIRKASTVEF